MCSVQAINIVIIFCSSSLFFFIYSFCLCFHVFCFVVLVSGAAIADKDNALRE